MVDGKADEPPSTVDCEYIARTLTEAKFQIAVLRSQEDKQVQQSARIQELLDKARSSSSTAPSQPESYSLFGNVFGGEDPDNNPASPAVSLSRKEIDKLKKDKASTDQLTTEIVRKISRLENSLVEAKAFVKRHMSDSITSTNEVRSHLKSQMVSVAEKVDRKGAECALTLGKFWLRTPYFFASNGLIGRKDNDVSGKRGKDRLPDLRIDLLDSESWAVYEEIDNLIEQAALQDETAVEQLLALLIDPRLQSQLRQHLVRCVSDKAAYLDGHDKEKSNDTGFRSALCAHWPKAHASSPNFRVYAPIIACVQDEAQEYDEEGGDASQGRASQSAAPATRATRMTTRRTGMGPRQSTAFGAVARDPLERSLKIVDSTYLEVLQKDRNLHITPQVMEALIKVAAAGLDRYQHEELVLFGCPDMPEVQWEEPHWFLRRKAALQVCEMAAEGNSLACDMICNKLLRDQEHWLVRSIVVEEVCRMLGQMAPDDALFRDFLDLFTRVLFNIPVVSTTPSRSARMQFLTAQALGNVQRSAEKAMTKELPQFSHDKKAIVLQDLMAKCQPREGDGKRQVMERILHVIGGVPSRAR